MSEKTNATESPNQAATAEPKKPWPISYIIFAIMGFVLLFNLFLIFG